MRSDLRRLLLLTCAVAGLVSACGQKGPLYLPEKTGEVVTRPARTETPPEPAPAPADSPSPGPSSPTQADPDSKDKRAQPK